MRAFFSHKVPLFSHPMNHELIKSSLEGILNGLNLPYEKIIVTEEEDITRVDIDSNEASRLIGWHGETLNALQHLLKSIIREKEKLSRAPFILVDVDGYRRIQEEKVCKTATQKADFVRRTNNRIALPPMSPYFRRIVHMYVANDPNMQDLTTESIGEGDYRQIVLRLKKDASPSLQDGEELAPVITEDDGGLDNLDI
jgi:spoIIIJ-associated protein